ncbi:MAG: ComEC/Rec2 family competence protein [Acetobacteraceae bacterium]|nr:ComEC/Rec2 family competence protein [Acetobacteraceae bacterium]
MQWHAITSLAERVQSRFDAWARIERGRFALFLPLAMAAGAAVFLTRTHDPTPMLAPAMLAQGGWLALAGRTWRVPRWIGALLAAGALGFCAAEFAAWRLPPMPELPRKASIVTGRVGSVEMLPKGRMLFLDAARIGIDAPLARRLRFRLPDTDATKLEAGDSVQLRAMLSPPNPPAYPGAWDLQRDAYFDGLAGYGRVLSPVQVLAHRPPGGAAAFIARLRDRVADRVQAALPGAVGAIAATLLTGEAASIPEADRAAFRDSGLSHILAIAGLHIGIVMGLIFGAVRGGLALSERAALFWPLKSVAALAALAAGLAYLLLTGAHVPIRRSFAMACLVTFGLLLGRRSMSLRGLALAMAAIVLAAPNAVLGVSFQMSFSAVLALISGYAFLMPKLLAWRGRGGWGRQVGLHLATLALTSLLAGTASAPFAAYHFGEMQIYFVLANMIAVPVTALLAMPAGLIALALMPLHLEALALVPMGWGVRIVLFVAHHVSAWPVARSEVPPLPPWGIILFSLGLAWLGLWRSRPRLLGLPAMLIAVLSPLWATPPDMMISADARLLGVRQAGRVELLRLSGAQRFTEDAWQRVWLGEAVTLDCTTPVCMLTPRPSGASAAILQGQDSGGCDAALRISLTPIRHHCTPEVPEIDRFALWREGAFAIWLEPGGARIVSDWSMRGHRPWVLLHGADESSVQPD